MCQAAFCVQVRAPRLDGGFDVTYVPMMAGMKFKEIGKHSGYACFVYPASEPVLFALTGEVCLHGVTTGFRLREKSEEANFSFLATHINPHEMVVIPTDGPIPQLNSFDYSQAAKASQVRISLHFLPVTCGSCYQLLGCAHEDNCRV